MTDRNLQEPKDQNDKNTSLTSHPSHRSGNEKVFGFLVGQVMKATQGKASPQMVNEILRKELETK